MKNELKAVFLLAVVSFATSSIFLATSSADLGDELNTMPIERIREFTIASHGR